ncbi:SdrD B-like domain-containing protein [Nesterenkonia haasae]|uniref:SdrD B-like domain-containing protein n=1 Tax=Nesterenkonia haasae TaxID=2587813 RepID=UPI001391A580|nr:SdrD B-like domain-containing protein [Nesterenkonia haasae]
MKKTAQGERERRTPVARLLSIFLAAIIAFTGVVALTPAAHAQTPGVSTTLLLNGQAAAPGAVVNPGDALRVNIQYTGDVIPGSTVEVELGGLPTSIDPQSLVVPSGNTAIDSVTESNGSIFITFADPFPDDVHQGVWALDYTVQEIERSESRTVTWRVDGEERSVDLIVRAPGDQFENVNDRLAKGVNNPGWGNIVTVDEAGNVSLRESVIGRNIRYALVVDTARDQSRDGFAISDQLPEHMVYNQESFTAELTTWDEHGRNRQTSTVEVPATFSGDNTSFSATMDLPSPSQLRITYDAQIRDEDARAALEAQLQERYDQLVSEDRTGEFRVTLTNTAQLGQAERTANFRIGGTIQGAPGVVLPNLNSAFSKTADWDRKDVSVDEDGTITPPADITYTLRTNLSQWDGRDEHHTLNRNVVVSDELPAQAQWNTNDAAFLTSEGLELTHAATFSGTAEQFAADEYVGQYAVLGQTLLINVGKNAETSATFKVKAQITSIADLYEWKNPNNSSFHYPVSNVAEFTYSDAAPHQREARVDVIVWESNDDGRYDPDKFNKTTLTDTRIAVAPGESATVEYGFLVSGLDLTKSHIVDYVDSRIFDLSDLDAVAESITGKYQHWRDLDSTHFNVTVDDDDNLIIRLSEAGIELVKDSPTDRLEINVALTTHPFDAARQTVSITNRASILGEDEEATYWSEVRSEATSYGDEAQVRKWIRDSGAQEWTTHLRAEVDEDGELVQDEYVYNIEFIPHGNYHGLTIIPVIDDLPAEVEFLGFVSHDNVDSGDGAVDGPVDIGGNLEASYDAENHRVTISSQEGKLLTKENNISANVLVRITDFELNTPIMNVIGDASAGLTPSDGYPLSIAKTNATDENVVIDDRDSVFEIRDMDGNVIVGNAYVENGFLRVLDEEGHGRSALVPEPGTYSVREVVAPEGYELSEEEILVHVGENGETETVTILNYPEEVEEETPTYAVGDYVWIDTNRDGIQDEDEDPLEGVTVVLLDGDGEELDRTTTDENGRYIFDELPEGVYQIRFELTEEQAEIYEFTVQNSDEDSTGDSDADTTNGLTIRFRLGDDNPHLTRDYEFQDFQASEGIDPTWDAGVILREPDEPEPTEPADPEPSEPTEPEPSEPADPEPSEPAEPEPSEPADPEPSEPTEPEPSEPVDPEPSEPADPEPSEPTEPEPSEPADPEPSEPTEPEPSEPADPEPSEPTEPEPSEPADPEPSEPTEPEPSEPADPEPSEPADPEPADPEPSEPADPEPSEPAPSEPAEPEPSEPADPEPSEPAPSEPAEPEPSEPVDPEPSEPTDPETSEPESSDSDEAGEHPGQGNSGNGNPASGKTLATTGVSVGLAVLAALALLGSGLMFRTWSSRRQISELDS